MTYEKEPFEFEGIPDFALQPAKDADEYNFHYIPRGATSRFDPAAYERVLHDSARQAEEIEEKPEMLEIPTDEASVSLEETIVEGFEELIPVAFDVPGEIPAGVAESVAEASGETIEAQAEVTEAEAAGIGEADLAPPAEQMEAEAALETVDFEEETSDSYFAAASITRPVFKPVFVPKTTPPKIVPVGGSLISSKLKLVDMKQKVPLRVTFEEDILVPDVKPDMARILGIAGKIKLAEKEIHTGQSEANSVRLLGDLILQTLYVPEHSAEGEPVISIESKIPFKSEMEMKAGPNSELAIVPNIESIDFTVVNERKFRVRTAAVFGIKEYSNVDIEVFEGLRDEEVQMLKEKINLTDVAARKTENIEIKDDLMLKENSPEILKVLSYDVNIVENHKQVTKEKAVINASVYCNVMYLGTEGNTDISKADDTDESISGKVTPVLYQGKTEFTQFIRLDGDYSANDQNPAGSKVSFNVASLNLTAKEDGNGKRNLFELDMNVDTGLELYKNVEKEVVTDVYHHRKDIQFETDDIGIMALGGSGAAEISSREIVNVPERYGNIDKVVYISGNINEKRSFIDQSKSIVEGVVTVNLICTSADAKKEVFNIVQEIPFRSAMEIPGITPDMVAYNDIGLKELWYDKINNKQIEVNAGIMVNTAVASQKRHQLVKNISFLESPQDNNPAPGIILYIARNGDNIWKIAKKYRTTIDEVRRINDLEYGKEIVPGTKLLIVAKNY